MLTWRDEYSVGIDTIDSQHKILFEIGNKAFKALKDDTISNYNGDITAILEELKNYTIFHFKTEEEYMISINYKMYLSHKIEHDNFIQKLNELSEIDNSSNNLAHLQGLVKFIVKWIFDHILKSDIQYKQ